MAVLATQTRASEFREALGTRVLVADGGMGAMLYAKRPFVNLCFDELNLSLPAVVRDVHREFVRAGAEILESNTFGANRKRLELFGFGEKVRQINQAGVRIAREAAREQAFVAGAVGPLGVRLEPLGATTEAEAGAIFREQIEALLEAGVDLLMLETFGDCRELRAAIFAAREVAGPEMVVAANVNIEDDGTLADGASTESFTRLLNEWPVDVVGVNCSSGPRVVLDTIEKMAAYTSKPLSAMPSAGLPGALFSPGYMAQYARRFVRAGVRIVGGCCGATPDHIRAIREEIQSYQPGPLANARGSEQLVDAPCADAPVSSRDREGAVIPLASKSHLGAKLADGRFVTLAQIRPPRGGDTVYKAEGIDALVVADGPGARLSAQATCQLIQQQAGIDTVLRFGRRVGSLASLQSELLGAHAMGVRNILCAGDDAVAIASVVNDLVPVALVLGVEMNPASLDQLEVMVKAGAEYLVARAVFDLDIFETLVRHAEQYKLPVVAGVWILTSFRDGEYLMNEKQVPIPPAYMARMSIAQNGAEEGVAIAREMVERLRPIAAGVQLSAPFGSCRLAIQVAEAIGPR